jgi:hypothetical protein
LLLKRLGVLRTTPPAAGRGQGLATDAIGVCAVALICVKMMCAKTKTATPSKNFAWLCEILETSRRLCISLLKKREWQNGGRVQKPKIIRKGSENISGSKPECEKLCAESADNLNAKMKLSKTNVNCLPKVEFS